MYYQKDKWKLILLGAAFVMALLALYQINRIVQQLKKEEQEKVKLWASAINKKAELVKHTEDFFNQVRKEEKNRLSLFLQAYRNVMEEPLTADINSSVEFVLQNNTIPLIMTDENNFICWKQNVVIPEGMDTLSGELLEEFTKESPVNYIAYGLHSKVYYKESVIYSDLRKVLDNFTQSFLSEVTDNTVFVPVVITDSTKTKVLESGNIERYLFATQESLHSILTEMELENTPIEILLPDNQKAFIFYKKSQMLIALQYYPLIYIFVAFVFVLIAYNFFRTARKSEQNQIWVGMSKETAHQLGTPISSLVAWVEYMKMKGISDEMTEEIEKDIKRLETIAQRFSKIGSESILKTSNIVALLLDSVSYLKLRTSKKIEYHLEFSKDKSIMIPINAALLEWVIENVCKNAIDAMGGIGTLIVTLTEDTKNVYIDIKDTGKGIPKSMFKTIFKPGFTTKQRGWGLGLSLAKRIVNEYHNGKIFVKSSIIGKGTTFRIVLRK